MKVLIDESLPRYLKQILIRHQVSTVQEMGWAGIKNGELLTRAESEFDVFMTADKNLRYQQNLQHFNLAVIVFPSNRLSVVKDLSQRVNDVLSSIKPSQVIEL